MTEKDSGSPNPNELEGLLGRPRKWGEQVEIENGEPVWTLRLNRYLRNNLLWLLNVVGWPLGKHTVEPFNLANTGDWNGQIPIMLGTELSDSDKPNVTVEELRIRVADWLQRQKDQKS